MTNKATSKSASAVHTKPSWIELLISAGVDAALEGGLNPNEIDGVGYTLMNIAASSASSDNLRKLVAAGGNILSEAGNGETVLHAAVSHNPHGYSFDTVSYILNEVDTHHKDLKASFINKQSTRGTALMQSDCHIGLDKDDCNTPQKIQDSFKMQLLLLENGADPSIVATHHYDQSFMNGLINMHYKTPHVASRLEQKGGTPEELKEYFDSGSFDAGFEEVLAEAVKKGLDINAEFGQGSIPIMQAVQTCNMPLFKVLRKLGANKPEGNVQYFHVPCKDSNDTTKMKCFIYNYDAIENCEVKPAAEQAPAKDDEL